MCISVLFQPRKLLDFARFFFWNRCDCYDLYDQCIPYMNAWEWQKAMVKKSITAIQEGHDVNDAVIILQHSPVYTMGTRSSEGYLLFDKKQPPCDLYHTERGGEVTYHGPGQVYCIFTKLDMTFCVCSFLAVDVTK